MVKKGRGKVWEMRLWSPWVEQVELALVTEAALPSVAGESGSFPFSCCQGAGQGVLILIW